MSYDVATIRADQSLIEACQEMSRLRVHHLPVVDNRDTVVGIVSAFDIVAAIAKV
jgi:CBS domain-containing protein